MSSDVLVVDPGELGELLATLFSQYGLKAACAKGGEQALEVALREQPGAIVVEYDLHDSDGLDVAELLREELGSKIVLTYAHHHLSGEQRDEFSRRLRTVDASFSRPFRSRSLIEKVAELLGHGVEPPETSGEFVIIPPDDDEEVLLLEDEAGDTGHVEHHVDDEDDDLIVDVDLRHLGDKTAPGHEFAYDGGEEPPPEPAGAPASSSPVPDLQAHAVPSTTGTREGVAVPISELEYERTKTGTRELADLLKKVRELGPQATESAAPADGIQPLGERKGRLTPRVLSDLLDAFHQSQTTGEVWLARGPAQRVLLLVRGVIVGARTNIAGERLLHLLEKRGIVPAEKLAALQRFGDDDGGFKKLAVSSGVLDETTLLRLIGEQTRRIVLGAFTWRDGIYKTTLLGHGKRERRRVVMSVGDAILRGVLLTEPLEGLRDAAPDDARFGPNPDAPYGLGHLTLTPDEARIVVAMDGTKTMGDLATLYPEVNERTRRGIAAGLLRLELLRFAGKGYAEARRISFF